MSDTLRIMHDFAVENSIKKMQCVHDFPDIRLSDSGVLCLCRHFLQTFREITMILTELIYSEFFLSDFNMSGY